MKKATSFRVRQRFGQWYCDLLNNHGDTVEQVGPYRHILDAEIYSESTGLRDADKGGLSWQE